MHSHAISPVIYYLSEAKTLLSTMCSYTLYSYKISQGPGLQREASFVSLYVLVKYGYMMYNTVGPKNKCGYNGVCVCVCICTCVCSFFYRLVLNNVLTQNDLSTLISYWAESNTEAMHTCPESDLLS